MEKDIKIRFRDKNLKDKWQGVNDKVPVNPQYVFEDIKREEAFLMSQFPTDELKERFKK